MCELMEPRVGHGMHPSRPAHESFLAAMQVEAQLGSRRGSGGAMTHGTETNMTPKTSPAQRTVSSPNGRGGKVVSHDGGKDPASRPPRKRGQANLERAHRTVTGMTEAAPGAPRSGSA